MPTIESPRIGFEGMTEGQEADTRRLSELWQKAHITPWAPSKYTEKTINKAKRDFLKMATDLGRTDALQFALMRGLSRQDRDGYPYPAIDILDNVANILKREPSFAEKFDDLLLQLLDISNFPAVHSKAENRDQEAQNWNALQYLDALFFVTKGMPKSSKLFEAGMTLLTSGDTRLDMNPPGFKWSLMDGRIFQILQRHQSDDRLRPTWEAALKGDPEVVGSYYPDVIDLNPIQGLYGILTIPSLGEKTPLDFITMHLATAVETLEKTQDKSIYMLDEMVYQIYLSLTPDEKNTFETFIHQYPSDSALVKSYTEVIKTVNSPRLRSRSQ